jgi:hypothetical protein
LTDRSGYGFRRIFDSFTGAVTGNIHFRKADKIRRPFLCGLNPDGHAIQVVLNPPNRAIHNNGSDTDVFHNQLLGFSRQSLGVSRLSGVPPV